MSRDERIETLRAIELARKSKVVAYICSDRQGAVAQLGNDAVRPLFEHLQAIGRQKQIDLFLYSVGGAVDVPWRIVTMIREFCDKFGVIVPYRAHSAATLLALGADEIVLGQKGELGPIDPSLTMETPEGQISISVEDVMAYMDFAKSRTGLTDQAGLASALSLLAEKVGPVILGSIYRQHSHIRAVARKMIASHREGIDEQKMSVIVETLAERVYAHGHAISRVEAKEIGLPLLEPVTDELEHLIWKLYAQYEDALKLTDPIDDTFLGAEDHREVEVVIAMIESTKGLNEFAGTLDMRAQRQMPPQLQATININLQLPPNVDMQQIPQQSQAVLQAVVQQAQQAAQQEIERAIKNQCPVTGVQARLKGGRWYRRDVAIVLDEPESKTENSNDPGPGEKVKAAKKD